MEKMLICNLRSKLKPSQVALNIPLLLEIGDKQIKLVLEQGFHRSVSPLFILLKRNPQYITLLCKITIGYASTWQVLNRLTYASTLSHLRRLNSPIGREGKKHMKLPIYCSYYILTTHFFDF